MKKNDGIRVFLIFALAVLIFPALVTATAEKPLTLAEAITAAKKAFEVPADFTKFSFSLNNYDKTSSWSLNWNKPSNKDGSGHTGSMNVTLNAFDGRINSMSFWNSANSSDFPKAKLPELTRAQARKIAWKLLERLNPKKARDLRAVENTDELISLTYSDSYTFKWERVVNGIAFPHDGVNVSVNSSTGKVTWYQLTWTDAEFPSPDLAISTQTAAEKFKAAADFRLEYTTEFGHEPVNYPTRSASVILVYDLVSPPTGYIDALTGKPVLLKDGEWIPGTTYAKDQSAMGMGGDAVQYTESELNAIHEMSSMVTENEALATVKKWVEIPSALTLTGDNLTTDWRIPGRFMWSFNWWKNDGESNRSGSVNSVYANVDASNGELLKFDLYSNLPSKATPTLTRKQAGKIAADFLKKIQPSLVGDTEPISSGESNGNPQGQGFRFDYRRMVDGIPYIDNGINVTVDPIDGRITHYDLNWDDGTDFPAASGILSKDDIESIFLGYKPLRLKYVDVRSKSGTDTVMLIYAPEESQDVPDSNALDAFSGKPVYRNDRSSPNVAHGYSFTDISGLKDATDVEFLGHAGLFGEYGNLFRPQEKIKAVSLIRAVMSITRSVYTTYKLSDSQVMEAAVNMKWIPSGEKPDSYVTRTMLAEMMVHLMGMDTVVKAKGIFKNPFKDLSNLSSDTLNSVALVAGLGIMNGNGENFMPDMDVTRLEAAIAVIRAIREM